MKELLLVVAFVLAIVWLAMRIRRGKIEVKEASTVRQLKKTSAFHAVSLKYSMDSCDAAKALTGRRFLSSDAPQLPLPDCDASQCRCGFAHHADRRSGAERRSPFNSGRFVGGTGLVPVERRVREDRRQSDLHVM